MTDRATPGLLFVHAHPDDETLTTGITLAHYRRRGARVHVLTCTLGEQGEVIPPELAHLDADHDDTLGRHRRRELRAAMAVLGVTHEVLGEDPATQVGSRYRDSGMAGTPSAAHPAAFARADLGEAAALVREVIDRVQPDAVVTYDAQGGYRHPDHIQTHRVTCAAVAAQPEGRRPDLYAVLTPRSWAREDRLWLAEHLPDGLPWTVPDPEGDYPPSVVDDHVVTHETVDASLVPAQEEALRAHRTQVTVGPGCYALSNDIAARLSGREGFARLDPASGAPLAAPAAGSARSRTLLRERDASELDA